jgi:hypothetical protein
MKGRKYSTADNNFVFRQKSKEVVKEEKIVRCGTTVKTVLRQFHGAMQIPI